MWCYRRHATLKITNFKKFSLRIFVITSQPLTVPIGHDLKHFVRCWSKGRIGLTFFYLSLKDLRISLGRS